MMLQRQTLAFLLTTALLPWLLAGGKAVAGGPDIAHWTTDGGMKVYHVQSETLPLVDLNLLFDAGSARDGEYPGLASLTSSLLSEGADGLSAGEVARLFEDLGARFSTDSGRDYASADLRSLSDRDTLTVAVDALARVISKPDFNEDALERERRRMLVSLERSRRDPGSIAQRAFWETAYGSHPYASRPGGTEESLETITADQVDEFHRRYYVRGNATLAIVGDLDRDLAEELANRIDAALPEGEAPRPLPEPEPLAEAKTVRIPFQSSQTHIIIGQPGYARGDEAHFPLYVGNHILGGSGLVSRLSLEMREQRGLSYGVSSNFTPMQTVGPFQLVTRVRSDRTDEALEVLLNGVNAMREDGPTEEELEDAIRHITGSFPLNLDSNAKITGYVASIGFHGLPLDYLDTFVDDVGAVTVEAVRENFRGRLDPSRMVTVIVGPEQDELD